MLVPCPPIHFVALSTTTSAPKSIGLIKAPPAPRVLSTIKGIPFSFAKAESPSKSGMLNRGFPIDSTYIALVLSSILFLKLSILSPSANLTSIPNLGNCTLN